MSGDFCGFKSRQAFYEAFDAAVLMLPADVRKYATLDSAVYDRGVWKFMHVGVEIGKYIEPWRAAADLRTNAQALSEQHEREARLYPKQVQQIGADVARRYLDPIVNTLADEVLVPMQKEIAELRTEKAIEVEVINELANCLERVDVLEAGTKPHRKSLDSADPITELPDTRIDQAVARYLSTHPMTRDLQYLPDTHEIVERWASAGVAREIKYPAGGIMDGGYWRDGMTAQAMYVYTNNGSAWIALRSTKAKPCHEAAEDWRLFARKGKDAPTNEVTR